MSKKKKKTYPLQVARNTSRTDSSRGYYIIGFDLVKTPCEVEPLEYYWNESDERLDSTDDYRFLMELCPTLFHRFVKGVRLRPGQGPVDLDGPILMQTLPGA